MLIRHADPNEDGAACAAIYAPSVIDGVASFEERAPDGSDMAGRIERTSARYPWLVAVEDEIPVGFAYATEHHPRAAYRWSADTSVYVAAGHQRRGIGQSLYAALLPLLRRQGLYMACAGITLPNVASVRLHERMGFELVGEYRQIGFKHGAWRTVGWWQIRLREPEAGAVPPEPLGPQRLDGAPQFTT